MVDVKKVPRRELKFSCENCIIGDIDKLAQGPIETTGNWTAGMIVQHVTQLIELSLDGFPEHYRGALPMRIMAKIMRGRILSKPWSAGYKLPPRFEALAPPEDITFEEAHENLRRAIGRLKSEQMTAKSAILGEMEHADWMKLHCRHAELHFGFLRPGEPA
jgi:Protein of unknown function (DUF1569)